MNSRLGMQSRTIGFLLSLAIHVSAASVLWFDLLIVERGGDLASHVSQPTLERDVVTRGVQVDERAARSADEPIVQAIEAMTNGDRLRLGGLVNHLWQSTVFALAVALLAIAFRRNHARVRYWLWFSASVKFLIPFALLITLGSALHRAPVMQTVAAPTVSTMAEIGRPFLETASAGLAPAVSTSGSADWTLLAALGVWACGFATIAVMRLQAWQRVRRVVRESRAIELPDVAVPRHVAVRVAAGLLEPAVVGIWRPVLLVPAGIEQHLPTNQLQAVVAHEVCHVNRRDNLTAAVHMLVEAVFWFHPLVWWVGARLVDERERACDEEVLKRGGEPRVYADGILNVCKRYVNARLACVSGVSGSNLKRRIEAIMTNQPREAVTRAKQFVLVASIAFVFAVPLGVGLVSTPLLSSQSPTGTPGLAFEVASVRRNVSGNRGGPFGPQPGGRFIATSVTLNQLIRFVYEPSVWNRTMEAFRVSGGPPWLDSDRFDVNAKAAREVPLLQLRAMLQTLLAERFKLRVHHEDRVLPIYRLALARSDGRLGPQMHRTELDCSQPIDPFRGFRRGESVHCGFFGMSPTIDPASGQSNQTFRGMTMEGLAGQLRQFLDRTVIDGTGLAGYYDGDFEFTNEIAIPPPPPGLPNPYEGRTFASVFSVLPQQLGLRLESDRGPVDVVVIDHAEPLIEN